MELETTPAESPPKPPLRGRIRTLLFHPGVRNRVLAPMGFDASILAVNLLSGIAIARALGPSGRGEIAAILLLTQLCVWFFSGGATEAVAYRLARNRGDGPRLLGSWFAIGVPLALLAIVAGELMLPILFSAQTAETILLGRIYLGIVVVMLLQVVQYGMLLGSHDFFFYNVVRLLQPALISATYLVCWALGVLSVEAALAINAAATGAAFLAAAYRLLRREGIERPSRDLLRETLSFGLRAHMGTIAGLVNARLDLLIIPAYLAAASVGLYSVATNVASVIGTLTGTISTLVLPVAASRRVGAPRTVIRTLHATLLIGFCIAIPVAIVADFALNLLYGSEFGGAATALRVMLPGEVLDAGALVIWSGLLAANRPALSSVAAVPAASLTIGGLILFLESGGIVAAAVITTCAYALVFVISVILYRRLHDLRWRDFLRAPSS
jgi:O-antigen/teichoic acid export membrane protein